MKLFIDECLSSELVHRAIERGHAESTSVIYRGLQGTKDWNLVPIVVAGDFTLVTKNSVDFRGAADAPGEKGLYKDIEVHAGLICLNGPKGMDLDLQLELFEIALDELDARGGDLVNTCLEVTLDVEDAIVITIYDLPLGPAPTDTPDLPGSMPSHGGGLPPPEGRGQRARSADHG